MRRKRGDDAKQRGNAERSSIPAEWVPIPPEPRPDGERPPIYYQPPPQVHYVQQQPPMQQTVHVHAAKRGCFGTVFQVIGFLVVLIIVILIIMAVT